VRFYPALEAKRGKGRGAKPQEKKNDWGLGTGDWGLGTRA